MQERTTRRFEAQEVAKAAAADVLRLLARVQGPYGDLADQTRRAATSAALNLAEGAGRSGKARLNHYRIAYGSAREAGTALELLVGAGAVAEKDAVQALHKLDRVRAMLWRLTH